MIQMSNLQTPAGPLPKLRQEVKKNHGIQPPGHGYQSVCSLPEEPLTADDGLDFVKESHNNTTDECTVAPGTDPHPEGDRW